MYLSIYIIDEWENALGSIRWAAEYFIKCHVSDYEFYGQVGDFSLDQGFWGRPEDMNMSRPSYKIDKNRPGKTPITFIKLSLRSLLELLKKMMKIKTKFVYFAILSYFISN